MAELKLDLNKLVPIAGLIIAVLVGLGVWNQIQSVQSQVVVLEARVAELVEVQSEIDRMTTQLAIVSADVTAIEQARDDILAQICRILERPVEQCGVS